MTELEAAIKERDGLLPGLKHEGGKGKQGGARFQECQQPEQSANMSTFDEDAADPACGNASQRQQLKPQSSNHPLLAHDAEDEEGGNAELETTVLCADLAARIARGRGYVYGVQGLRSGEQPKAKKHESERAECEGDLSEEHSGKSSRRAIRPPGRREDGVSGYGSVWERAYFIAIVYAVAL